jgi:hypothetical protein
MRIGRGGFGWQAVGCPVILIDDKPVSVPDLLWADDELGEVALIDWSKSVDNGHGYRVFPPGSVTKNGGVPPFTLQRGKVEFRFKQGEDDGREAERARPDGAEPAAG